MNIAIITARKGSKRIPKKNIKNFLGKPIIAYPIEAAIESKVFDVVMVSTDCEDIASIAKSYGAVVPFYRSPENSDDFATTADVIAEVLEKYREKGKIFESFCCIYPTAVFINSDMLLNSWRSFQLEGFDSLMPIVEFEVPIQIALEKDSKGKVKMVNPDQIKVRTQDMKKHYYDPGQFYWAKVAPFMESKNIFMDNTGGFIVSSSTVHDIDNEEDWKIAEFKYKLIHES